MPGLTRFSAEERIRMKRLQVQDGKSCNSIAQAINLERPSDRLCTARLFHTDLQYAFISGLLGKLCLRGKTCNAYSPLCVLLRLLMYLLTLQQDITCQHERRIASLSSSSFSSNQNACNHGWMES